MKETGIKVCPQQGAAIGIPPEWRTVVTEIFWRKASNAKRCRTIRAHKGVTNWRGVHDQIATVGQHDLVGFAEIPQRRSGCRVRRGRPTAVRCSARDPASISPATDASTGFPRFRRDLKCRSGFDRQSGPVQRGDVRRERDVIGRAVIERDPLKGVASTHLRPEPIAVALRL
jgi:hypothetical protein